VCDDESKPSPDGYRRNLALPMPFTVKIRLVAKNMSRRFYPRLNQCCGNHGEPGC
jgi:hypothetical protein